MAYSNTISTTPFNVLKVLDSAFRRCRLPPQTITSEMLSDAKDTLYLWLSQIGNNRVPSWCIEKQVYGLSEGQSVLTLSAGTVAVLNANLRTLSPVESVVTTPTANEVVYDLGSATSVVSVGVKGTGVVGTVSLQVSTDGVTWVATGSLSTISVDGEWRWGDLSPVTAKRYLRIISATALGYSEVFLGTSPQEIQMGVLNRDNYVDQSNKTFAGRPLTYWFQRNIASQVLNLWPAPNLAAEHNQIVVWRHRHVMDVGPLAGDIEVPQRWMDAIVDNLAAVLALETAQVDATLLPLLEARAARSLEAAWGGDTDGSPTQIRPGIGCYTA